MSNVERCELAPGFSVSRALTGLWQIADMERDGTELDPEPTSRAMEPYVEAGLTTFDMADHYGSAEVIAGTYRKRNEDRDVQLLTKWVPGPGAVTREQVRDAIQLSLDRLQANTIDLLQFHAWNYHDLSYLDCLEYLQDLRDEGLIRHLGLTNFDTAHLRVAVESGIDIVSNQVSHSLVDRRAAGAMTDCCRERGVKILAYGTLLGGFLSDRWLGVPEPKESDLATWSQTKYKRFIDTAGGWEPFQRVLRAAADVAASCNASIANVASRYILDGPAVGGVIVGARLGQSAHVDDTLRMLQLELDDEARAKIAGAIDGLTIVPGDCGDEYRKPPFLTASGDLSHHLQNLPAAFEPIDCGDGRTRVSSGTEWEHLASYSRAVRDGRRISVSGTTATHGTRTVGGDDPAAQTHFVLDKVAAAVESLGGRWEDIVRTRIYVRDVAHTEAIALAHGARFAGVFPANTLVEAKLVGDDQLVEIEAEAMVPER